jgi:CheY-like chemotaxis protein
MKSLLFYNDNIDDELLSGFKANSEATQEFKIGFSELGNENFSVDNKIADILAKNSTGIEYEVIFIPYSLSDENYIEFLGLRIAYHIRLSKNFNNQFTPIVFFGNETPEMIYKITDFAAILFTPGVYCTTKFKPNDFQKQKEHIKKHKPRITESEFQRFLERINIQPPANYANRHSIANEWAIYRWSQALQIENDDDFKNIKTNLENLLYFKYLNFKFPNLKSNKLESYELQIKKDSTSGFIENERILLIDDEIEKGWGELFCNLLYDKCKIKHFDSDFGFEIKDKSKSEIKQLALNKIKSFNPDVIILDLRLHDSDFETKETKEVTGFQILNEIKAYNKGIQVIIFSATNKIWNLEALQAAGADGFIMKESPENSIDENFTKESIKNIIDTIDSCLEMKFLKEIYPILNPLIDILKTQNSLLENNRKKFNLKIQPNKVDNYYKLIQSAEMLLYSNPKKLEYCYLQIMLVIEDIIKDMYIDDGKTHYIDKTITEKIICLEQSENKITLQLSPLSKWYKFEKKQYVIEKEGRDDSKKEYSQFSIAQSIPFNYKLSCVLHFKYNFDINEISNFTNLYPLRSNTVAHLSKNNDKIEKEDIINSLKLLNILLN